MIGLDTNVLVRYIIQDDRLQTTVASRILDSLTPEAPGYLSLVVIAELVWVLESSYGFRRPEVLRILETLLQSEELIVERSELVWQTLRSFRMSNGDFADCLIERTADAAGCDYTLTFDRKEVSAGMKLAG